MEPLLNTNGVTETLRPTANILRYIGGATLREPKKLDAELDALLNKRPQTVLFSLGSISLSKDMPMKLKQAVSPREDYKQDIKHLYELESLGLKTESDPDEASIIKFMDTYRRTIIIKEGTITAGFPFNENVSKLKDNFNIAFRRLQALLRTLRGDAKKLQLYNTTIEDYTREGIIEECTSQPTGHIEEEDTPIGKELSKSLYVDNVLLEGNNPQELIEKYSSSKQVFSSIGMNLRDYLSDSAEVNAQIKDVDRAKNCELKVLGIKWKADDDTLIMECADKEQVKITKRSVLSQINGFCFDPLGLLTPLMIPAKIFLQDIHKLKLGWDTILPEEQIQRWKAIQGDIVGFKKAIPRTVLNKTPEAKYILSIFVDSSKRAYACCLYTTTSAKNGMKSTSLFTAKAKVAPIKKEQTIPRLELLSIFLGDYL
ncbi:unnamed protein product [Cylicocyclus nassatus]|uniref:Uncharacterized protein n=1 Tax=Cylicocyclus nassatus TaxID=53992 RepID=A0AA36HDF4_CYLNA|nr:unnamed protein product [Cylicocyclus nassatus]